MTFLEHIQNEVGCNYPLKTILDNLEEDDILDSIEKYLKYKKSEILEVAKDNRRFDSGTDKVGFIYYSQLEELFA